MIKPLERDPNVVDIEELLERERAAENTSIDVERRSWISFWGHLDPRQKAHLVEAIRQSEQYDIYLRRQK